MLRIHLPTQPQRIRAMLNESYLAERANCLCLYHHIAQTHASFG